MIGQASLLVMAWMLVRKIVELSGDDSASVLSVAVKPDIPHYPADAALSGGQRWHEGVMLKQKAQLQIRSRIQSLLPLISTAMGMGESFLLV